MIGSSSADSILLCVAQILLPLLPELEEHLCGEKWIQLLLCILLNCREISILYSVGPGPSIFIAIFVPKIMLLVIYEMK